MSRCAGSKPDGTSCERIVTASQSYCYSHDPERTGERKRNAARAGRSKPSQDLVGIKRQLQELTDDALAGKVERGVASVCGQLLNVKLRAVEVDRKIRETEDLEERLCALELAEEAPRQGGKRWGA